MRSYVKEYKVYQFKELTEEAKEKAKNDYLRECSDLLVRDFEDYANEYLSNKYPNSDLKVEFDFSCSQGSGLNIYGSFVFSDFDYTGKDDYNWLLKYVNEFELRNHCDNYTYSLKSIDKNNTIDIVVGDFNDNMPDYAEMDEDGRKEVEKLIDDIFTQLENIEKDLYNTGYDMLTSISDEDMQEISSANEWEYLEGGSFFTE